jgi:hypothetical protein
VIRLARATLPLRAMRDRGPIWSITSKSSKIRQSIGRIEGRRKERRSEVGHSPSFGPKPQQVWNFRVQSVHFFHSTVGFVSRMSQEIRGRLFLRLVRYDKYPDTKAEKLAAV